MTLDSTKEDRFTEHSVCRDCAYFIAYGDTPAPDAQNPKRPEEYLERVKARTEERGLGKAWYAWWHINNPLGFGTTPCDYCGSRLHGDRWRALSEVRPTPEIGST